MHRVDQRSQGVSAFDLDAAHNDALASKNGVKSTVQKMSNVYRCTATPSEREELGMFNILPSRRENYQRESK